MVNFRIFGEGVFPLLKPHLKEFTKESTKDTIIVIPAIITIGDGFSGLC